MIAVSVPKLETPHRTVQWAKVSQYEWRAGNVRIIACDDPDREWLCWYVKIKHEGRWRWAYCSQRPWGYGHASSAKRGVAKWTDIYFYDEGPQSESMRRKVQK